MLNISNKIVMISGLPDIKLKSESEKFRRGMFSEDDYKIKYQGLDILYFNKDWLISLGLDQNYDCFFTSHEMPGFAQNDFRFDCTFYKKDI
jgi:hypothetical protein